MKNEEQTKRRQMVNERRVKVEMEGRWKREGWRRGMRGELSETFALDIVMGGRGREGGERGEAD